MTTIPLSHAETEAAGVISLGKVQALHRAGYRVVVRCSKCKWWHFAFGQHKCANPLVDVVRHWRAFATQRRAGGRTGGGGCGP